MQVADIGLMGGPAKMNGKATEGVRIFLGGTIGEEPVLASEFEKGIPAHEDYLIPKLKELLIERFGATEKEGAVQLPHTSQPTLRPNPGAETARAV